MTTIEQQIQAVSEARRIMGVGGTGKDDFYDKELNDALSSLASLKIMIGNPEQFKKDLHKFLSDEFGEGFAEDISPDVVKFLKGKGFPI